MFKYWVRVLGVKLISSIVIVAVLITVLANVAGDAIVQAAGDFWSTTSQPMTISSPGEPVGISRFGLANTDVETHITRLYPGEEIALIYEVTNRALVDYVVEVHPVFADQPDSPIYGDAVGWLNYQFEDVDGAQVTLRSQLTLNGSAVHVLVAAGSMTKVYFSIGSKKDAPADLKISFEIAVHRTDCTVPEECPWG